MELVEAGKEGLLESPAVALRRNSPFASGWGFD